MRCRNEVFNNEVPFLFAWRQFVCFAWARIPASLAATLLVNWDPKWDVKTKCWNWGPLFWWRQPSLSVCLSVLGGQRMPASQTATLLVNWDPKWDVKTKGLKWGPCFWWRQPLCLFWAAKECRLHRRPRCLLTEILNEMSKGSVWNEVPFCAGGSLSVLLAKNAGFTRRPRKPASQAATLRVTEVLNEMPQRGPFLLEAGCLFCRFHRAFTFLCS